jgi:Flp pilus assembly protein TadG
LAQTLHAMRATWSRLRRRLRRGSARLRQERGQGLVEVAIVLPILLLLLAVVVDAARAFDAYIVLTNAAREGARFGSLQLEPQPIEVERLVINDVRGSGTNITHMATFTRTNVDVTEVYSPALDAVTVTVWFDFPLWFGGLVGFDTFHLEKSAAMPKYKAED